MVFIGENDIKKAAEKSAANLVDTLILQKSGYKITLILCGQVVDMTDHVMSKIIENCFTEAVN